MRGFITSPIGASWTGFTCAAVLALPLALPARAAERAAVTTEATVPGRTQSLPLLPVSRTRAAGAAAEQGLYRAEVGRFSLVGVAWDDPDAELHGRVQVRTRSTATGEWSGWQDVETHYADDGADPDTAERSSGRVHGATAPLWTGDSDGVDVRVRADAETVPSAGRRDSRTDGLRQPLPSGLRLELVDPGRQAPPPGPAAGTPRISAGAGAAIASSAANVDIARFGAAEIPALGRRDTERELVMLRGEVRGKPYIGPRPAIVTRRGWGADEALRERGFVYTKKVKAAFVHHTASGNRYTCSQAPSVIRSIYRYHVRSMGWRDVGYNFLVDKCGTIYEGRAGGVTKAVLGAHTRGFNADSMGIAVIGTYGSTQPSAAAVNAIARLTAWKLGLFGANPLGKTYLTSGGGNLYPKGKNARLNVISGHRDGYATECPGRLLYARLGSARSVAAQYQGR
ncbi:peptidoglycan recognition protein [Streptomyces sp. NK08204]|uniref:peptidoglycan recognition protein family protein n=1 Tax=Streptomyces sp. NK08204 TaxID=2873260 RepID=UPI001CED2058|nr:peptidoglycan recognition protein [Streptomyces sp. NK08204]